MNVNTHTQTQTQTQTNIADTSDFAQWSLPHSWFQCWLWTIMPASVTWKERRKKCSAPSLLSSCLYSIVCFV